MNCNDEAKKSSNEDLNCRCCCPPYPKIDLSPIFKSRQGFNASNSEIQKERAEVQRKLKQACFQYGCFHVLIDTDSLANSDQSLSMLANMNDVKAHIESLFEQDFLQSISSNEKNRSMLNTPFPGKDAVGKERVLTATYRGRSAESGSNKSNVDQGEPKQSWEIFRSPQNTSTETPPSPLNSNKLEILQQFVNNLHKVVVALCLEALDLPTETFVCSEENHKPNKDLLRVFRYDALSTTAEQESNLGSSTHTDWGSLTVVWQDTVGGLQIYCHKNDCWNDVDAKGDEVDEENKTIRLFIHVGDFLSLAFNSCHYDNNGEITMTKQKMRWPSPTHRVICPIQTNSGSSFGSRCSLVYFAYPPDGISLSDAIKSMKNIRKGEDNDVQHENDNTQNLEFPFKRYMLLNDQSVENPSNGQNDPNKKSQRIFETILHQSFNEVIENKWNQVQRKEE